MTLAQTFNDQHKLGVDLTGQVGGNLFKLGSPSVLPKSTNAGNSLVTATISDTSQLTTSDYTLSYDGTNYNLVRMSDNKTVSQPGAAATYPLDDLARWRGRADPDGDAGQRQLPDPADPQHCFGDGHGHQGSGQDRGREGPADWQRRRRKHRYGYREGHQRRTGRQ
ncbi:hypothetical protein ACU4GD_04470 [Cupriavidus basilensis]